MMTRVQLLALSIATFLSGGRRTKAEGARDFNADFIASAVNKVDDGNVPDGYFKLNSYGLADPTFLASSSGATQFMFLRDDGSYQKITSVVRSSAGALTLSQLNTTFVFFGTTSTWTSMVVSGNREYKIVNTGSGTITLNYPGGQNRILDLSTLTLVNTVSILTGTAVTIIDDNTNLIIF